MTQGVTAVPPELSLSQRTVPKARYLSPEFLTLELERVFPRTWLLAGSAADLDAPGSFFTFDFANESILVTRDETGVRAFHNVCQHRGRRLAPSGRGRASAFRCPYHHWEYGLDGSLIALPDAGAFASCRGFESLPIAAGASRLGLTPVACETWQGLVWVHLGDSPEPLSSYLGPLADRVAAYDLESFALEQDATIELDCNWKVSVDAFNEAYHLRAVHPQLLDVVDETAAELELIGKHSLLRVPFGAPSPSARRPDEMNDLVRWWLGDAGVDGSAFEGPVRAAREEARRALRARSDLRLERLSDEQLTDNYQFYVFPNATLNLYATRMMLLRHRPHPTDPGRMLLDQQQYVRVPQGAPRPARPAHESGRFGSGGSLGHVTDQDAHTLVRVQRGMRSRGFDALVLGAMEERILHMHRVLDHYLFGSDIAP